MKKVLSIHPDGKKLGTNLAQLYDGVFGLMSNCGLPIHVRVLADKSVTFYTDSWSV